MYNREMFLYAYQKIASNEGNMTRGTDGKTIDGMSIQRIYDIIETLKTERYRPCPSKRTYIPKKNGKLRPLGIPSVDDKLVQEVCRMILESIYEPTFESTSHGFRNHRSCHTALLDLKNRFQGCRWFVEGDIEGFFNNIDHDILIQILRERIRDERFINLIRKFLRAGYMENWQFNSTYSGTPQGGIISPLLANIYLDQLDKYICEYKEKFDKGAKRAVNPEYKVFIREHNLLKKRLAKSTDEAERKSIKKEMKNSTLRSFSVRASDDMDSSFKRLQYVRYADDFLIGIIDSKSDAEEIKRNLTDFISEKLKLKLSEEKTLITNAHKPARFLGYDVKIRKSNAFKKQKSGKRQRQFANKVVLEVPTDLIKKKLLEYGAMKISVHNGKEIWVPTFTLLIDKAAGTRYENFNHEYVTKMSYAYEQFYAEAKKRRLAKAEVSREEFHVLISSFWTCVCEPIIHDMSWEQIEEHCRIICRFFNWSDVIMLKKGIS